MSSYKGNDWSGGATKLQKFVELISSTSEPTLVFCQFKTEMDILAEHASELGYNVCFVRGGMTETSRTGEIKKTRDLVNMGKPTILLCQINAGNCGLNLQHLTRVIFYTQHWNPSVIDQAMTRSYRYGQTKNVTVHHLVLSSDALLNIDNLMLQKHHEKRRKAMSLMPSLKFAYHPDITIDAQVIEPIQLNNFNNERHEEDEDPTLVI
jgi:SNF2 family DNA or RNA helicase